MKAFESRAHDLKLTHGRRFKPVRLLAGTHALDHYSLVRHTRFPRICVEAEIAYDVDPYRDGRGRRDRTRLARHSGSAAITESHLPQPDQDHHRAVAVCDSCGRYCRPLESSAGRKNGRESSDLF